MTLNEFIEIIWRRQRRLFLAVFLITFGAAAVYTFSLPNVYQTDATLFVGENRPISAGADAVQLDEVLAASYAELLDTRDVEEKVAAELPFELDPSELEGMVDFSVITGTRLVNIEATAEDPERAQTIANTYAETFVRDRLEGVEEADSEQLTTLNERIGALAQEVSQLQASSDPQSVSRLAQAENELQALQTSYRAALQNAGLAASNVSVSSAAALPESPARPRPKLYMAIAFVLALVLATVAALFRNAFDMRVEREADILAALDTPLLTRVPQRGQSVESTRAYWNSIHFLRVNLEQLGPRDGARVIAVTSAAPGDGKTTIVSDLARALAETEARVVAVDCDLRKPRLAQSLGVDPVAAGLGDVLAGRSEPAMLLQPNDDDIIVLSAGSSSFDPAVLLDGPALKEVITKLRHGARWILIDTPPVLAGAETSSIFSAVDGVLLVADASNTRRDHLRATRQQLSRARARVLGVVVNRVDVKRGAFGYYYATRDEAPEGNGRGARWRRAAASARSPD